MDLPLDRWDRVPWKRLACAEHRKAPFATRIARTELLPLPSRTLCMVSNAWRPAAKEAGEKGSPADLSCGSGPRGGRNALGSPLLPRSGRPGRWVFAGRESTPARNFPGTKGIVAGGRFDRTVSPAVVVVRTTRCPAHVESRSHDERHALVRNGSETTGASAADVLDRVLRFTRHRYHP